MKTSQFSEEKIIYFLKQAEAGVAVKDICRQAGVSQATFYKWKNKFAGMGVSEAKKLRHLEQENARLKKLVADLTLDKHILQEVIEKKL